MKYQIVNQILLDLHKDYKQFTESEITLRYNEYLYLLRKLAYSNHAQSQFDLANHYDDIGFWGAPNKFCKPSKKFYWLNRAASNGFAEAYNNLANMYENEEYVNLDLNQALELYKKGGELGSKYSKKITKYYNVR